MIVYVLERRCCSMVSVIFFETDSLQRKVDISNMIFFCVKWFLYGMSRR